MSKPAAVRKSRPKTSNTDRQASGSRLIAVKRKLSERRTAYLLRRPHRSFRRTLRRDYSRSLDLPGYWSFTGQVFRVVRLYRRIFIKLILTYAVLGALFVGLIPQDAYGQLSQLLDSSGKEIFSGGWGSLGQAGLLLLSGISGSLSPQYTEAQQIFSVIILLLTWLTTVWLLRGLLAGKAPSLRDGIYNSGAPIFATAVVLAAGLIQLMPATIGIIIFNSAVSTELFQSGFIAMVITLAVGLLIILSMYWIVSTVFALIIVTLPGMYPWQALRTAGDIVVGRRLRILLRVIWLMVGNAISWVVIVLPVILVERSLKSAVPFVSNIPIVPVAMALVGAVIVVWSATYIYMLYRKVVEDDAKPA